MLFRSDSLQNGFGYSIEYDNDNTDFPIVTWKYRTLVSAYSAATELSACPIAGYTSTKLTEQKLVPDSDLVGGTVERVFNTLPGAIYLMGVEIDKETNSKVRTYRRKKEASSITPSASIIDGELRVIERKNINDSMAWEVTTYYPAPEANSEENAVVTTQARPFRFPGFINIPFLDAYGTAIGWTAQSAQLVEHTIKTWWVLDSVKPTLEFDEIIPATVVINDVTYHDVLHDEATRYYADAPVTLPATTPDYSTYISDWIGTDRVIDGGVKDVMHQLLWRVEQVTVVMRAIVPDPV